MCEREITSSSPAMTKVGTVIAASSSTVSVGSLANNLFAFSTTARAWTAPSGERSAYLWTHSSNTGPSTGMGEEGTRPLW